MYCGKIQAQRKPSKRAKVCRAPKEEATKSTQHHAKHAFIRRRHKRWPFSRAHSAFEATRGGRIIADVTKLEWSLK